MPSCGCRCAEVARIQRRMEVPTIYVTHDQVEAMTMGDRITVMRDGTLQRVDTSQHLYDNPDNIFVAAFIGSPAMNLYDAVVGEGARSLELGSYAGKEVSWACAPSTCPRRPRQHRPEAGRRRGPRQRQDPGQARRQADLRRGHP